MMAEDNSWLPLGWTAQVKLCKNGRKYKCYVDPSHELKFHSKPEVLRYLNSKLNNPKAQVKHGNAVKLPKSQVTTNLNVKLTGENFVVEKTTAEGLPPGWIKEVRITKKRGNIRKDLFYTDPISGYVFRSLKEIERYLKTGELGRNAYKPKDNEPTTVDAEDDNLSKLPCSGKNEHINKGKCSKVAEIMKDEERISVSSRDDDVGLSRHYSDKCSEVAATTMIPLQTKSLEQREEKGECNVHTPVSAPVVRAPPGEILGKPVEGEESNGSQRRANKSSDKRAPDLPRRSSKRLAGIELNPAPDMKTNNRTRRLVTGRSSGSENSSADSFHGLATVEERPRKLLETMTNETSELSIVLPLASLPVSEKLAEEEETLPIFEERAGEGPLQILAKLTGGEEHLPISEEHTRVEEPASEADVKPGSPLNLSLTDLWKDPCIEFAIKTLTGAIPVGYENKSNENPGSSSELPFGELWADPCIEFAVKTLTGAIPVGEDLAIQNFFQQHLSSSDSRGVNVSIPPNVDNFSQTDYIPRHLNGVESKQQAPVASKLLDTSNRSFQSSSGRSSFHFHVEGRSSGEHS